jgi:hypothetical protein
MELIALAKQPPPGRLVRYSDGSLEARDEQKAARWSLDALAQAAKEAGISVKRSQIRTIFLRKGVRWRNTHSWGTSDEKDAGPKRVAVVSHDTDPPTGSTTICTDELGPVLPRSFPPAPGWSPNGHRYQRLWNTAEDWRKPGSLGRYACMMGKNSPGFCCLTQLNARARPWVWGRPPKTRRRLRRLFSYRI